MSGNAYDKEMNPNLNFLLVDDDPRIVKATRLVLKSAGFKNIHTAENGAVALDMLREHGIDLVFLDWDMPVINGPELLERMNEKKMLKYTKVIVMTAHSEKDYVLSALQLGASSYVVKPFAPKLLYAKLEEVFNARIVSYS